MLAKKLLDKSKLHDHSGAYQTKLRNEQITIFATEKLMDFLTQFWTNFPHRGQRTMHPTYLQQKHENVSLEESKIEPSTLGILTGIF